MAETSDIEAHITRFGSMVHRRCRQMLGDEDEALDATQEVFVKLVEMGDVEISAPSSLLYVIATRVCLNRLRTQSRRPETASGDLVYEIATHDTLGRTIARDLLSWLFEQNPESSRVIAVMHFSDGMTLTEVAQEVGMSVSGVRKRIRIMREQLNTLNEGES